MAIPQNLGPAIDEWHSERAINLRLNFYVLGTAILLASIMTLRALRNRTGWPVIKFGLMMACYLSPHALSYVLGKLSDYPFDNRLMNRLIVVWTVFLIVLDGMTYNSTSDSLEENEATRKRFLWDKMVPSIWFLFLLFWGFPFDILFIPLIVLWLLYILKLSERKQALMYASRSRGGLDRVAMVITEYMQRMEKERRNSGDEEERRNPPRQKRDPATMQGYKYMVGVKQALKKVVSVNNPPLHVKDIELEKITTIDDIWQCKGTLLAQGKEGDLLKDTCLSFALFWLLLRRFADQELAELSDKEESLKFVREGLVKEDKYGERAFRVVGVELQFLSDYFFNNYFAVYCKGTRFLLVRLVVFVIYVLLCFVTVKFIRFYNGEDGEINAQIVVTEVVIYTLSLVELVQIINIFTSRWNKVKWTCSYVRKQWWEPASGSDAKSWESTRRRFKGYLLHLLCRAPCFTPFIGPWHNKLRQYSLLDSYGHKPLILKLKFILEGYIEFPIKGQKEGSPVELSNKVKKEVISSLQINNWKLSNGLNSLNRNNVALPDRLRSLHSQEKGATRIILVWHIATSICEIAPKQPSNNASNDFEKVATSLSRYCAYLVAFAPNLLPDLVYTTQWLFEEVVFETVEKLKMRNTKARKYEQLMRLADEENAKFTVEKSSTLELGALLGKNLMEKIKEETERWKVLAEFWAEMILFLAPSKNPAAHAEYLATGGEFITHLWALLTHAGIVERDGCSSDFSI